MTIAYADAVSEQVPASDATVYTCPSTVSSAQIIFANCTNEDASDTTLTVNIVQSGSSVAVTNQYFPSTTIAAGTTNGVTAIVGAILKAGDFISVVAGVADRLNFKVGIKEIR